MLTHLFQNMIRESTECCGQMLAGLSWLILDGGEEEYTWSIGGGEGGEGGEEEKENWHAWLTTIGKMMAAMMNRTVVVVQEDGGGSNSGMVQFQSHWNNRNDFAFDPFIFFRREYGNLRLNGEMEERREGKK